ncbi:MAG: ABC transporter ATP-binding protein [Deltaproteobacteria bacterium]|nr:ABC transporter ATP-binding protein [Deltaproteobacteria bacterium]
MLNVQNLTLPAGKIPLLQNFSFHFQSGRMTVLLGPNGAGKTTLLRSLAESKHRNIFFNDEETCRMPASIRSEKISWMPAEHNVPFDFTVADLMQAGRFPWHKGFPGRSDDQFVEQIIETLKISHLRNKSYNHLSSGEKQKVMAGRVLCQDTPVMILDEPVAHMDLSTAFQLMDIFRQQVRKGRCVIMSLHQPELALHYGDDALFIKAGQQPEGGPVKELCTEKRLSALYGISVRLIRDGRHTYFCAHPPSESG